MTEFNSEAFREDVMTAAHEAGSLRKFAKKLATYTGSSNDGAYSLSKKIAAGYSSFTIKTLEALCQTIGELTGKKCSPADYWP